MLQSRIRTTSAWAANGSCKNINLCSIVQWNRKRFLWSVRFGRVLLFCHQYSLLMVTTIFINLNDKWLEIYIGHQPFLDCEPFQVCFSTIAAKELQNCFIYIINLESKRKQVTELCEEIDSGIKHWNLFAKQVLAQQMKNGLTRLKAFLKWLKIV